VATLLLKSGRRMGLPAAALACGLQIRTTHVTGMVTDLGMLIGHWIRRQPADRRKFALYTLVFLAFGAGGDLGAVAHDHFSTYALLLPAIGCVVAGLVYSILVRVYGHRLLPLPPAATAPPAKS